MPKQEAPTILQEIQSHLNLTERAKQEAEKLWQLATELLRTQGVPFTESRGDYTYKGLRLEKEIAVDDRSVKVMVEQYDSFDAQAEQVWIKIEGFPNSVVHTPGLKGGITIFGENLDSISQLKPESKILENIGKLQELVDLLKQ